jgi:hypothetical protein
MNKDEIAIKRDSFWSVRLMSKRLWRITNERY